MKPRFTISIAALMLWVTALALQLALFQGAWVVLVIPPLTIAALALNLALYFVLVRPAVLNTRIIGMLLAAIVAAIVTILPLNPYGYALSNQVQQALDNWTSSQPDPARVAVAVIRFVSEHLIAIAFALLDVIGVSLIWAGGALEDRLRRRRDRPARVDPGAASPS